MTTDHRAEAEKHLDTAARHLTEDPGDMRIAEVAAAIGQVHATLARDEEQAARTADMREAAHSLRRRLNDTRELVAAHIANGLTSRDKNRWQAARDLAQALDEAHSNVDNLVDARLSDDGYDTKTPWSHPEPVTPAADPWAQVEAGTDTGSWGTGITRHEAAMSVVTLHIAEALLDAKSEDVRAWARGLAHELKRERIDLLDDIGRHMQRMALGGPTNQIPF